MLIGLYFCAIFICSVELLFTGMVVGFFQKKFVINDMLRFLLSALFATLLLGLGNFVGNIGNRLVTNYSIWYAATVLFILGLKMFYDGLKLYKLKRFINPLDFKGSIVLAILAGLNAFFVGLSFGLLQIGIKYIYLTSKKSYFSFILFDFK
jgi:putative Mn2+ efflux pump MntP